MPIKMANNAIARLAAPLGAGDTTLVLVEVGSSTFPTPAAGEWHPLTMLDGVNMEIMRVTARVDNVLTVVRAQEGTAARSFSAGVLAEVRWTEAAVMDLQAATAAVQANVNALASDVATDITVLETQIATKASQASLNSLATTVSGKASQADLNTLSATVAGLATSKANQTDLDVLSAIVATKASQTGLDALSVTVGALSVTVDTKASQASVNAIAGIPTGAGLEWFTDTLPAGGFLWQNGAAVSRATYAALFGVIGTTFGAGDGSTTFNLPDKRGRVSAGSDDMGGVTTAARLTTAGSGVDGVTLGASGGAQSHTLTSAQIPAHTHPITDPGHTHTQDCAVRLPSSGNNFNTPFNAGGTNALPTNPSFTGITVGNNTGGGSAHNNVQPTIITNWVIKT